MDFVRTLRPILTTAKLCGFINIVYVLNATGLLVRDTSTIYYSFLEIVRMLFLLICGYKNFNNEFRLVPLLISSKFWVVLIVARVSEIWIIKFINGISEYDRKLARLPKMWTEQRSMSKHLWNIFLVSLFVYYVAFQTYFFYTWPPKSVKVLLMKIIFHPPYIVDFVVIILCCFCLVNVEQRFQTLNSVWQRLPPGLVAVPGSYTYSEIAVLVETIRLLHAELCELLRIFSLGFGHVLLAYFVMSYVSLLHQFALTISLRVQPSEFNYVNSVMKSLLPYILDLQHLIFLMFIIVTASRTIEKKNKMISHLRKHKISDLPIDLKLQIKQFMNQISVFDSHEINAFGLFNIDLNLAVKLLVLIITGISTLIQMKEHPIILFLVNDAKSFIAKLIENNKNT